MRIQIAGNRDYPDFGERAYVESPEGQGKKLFVNDKKYPIVESFFCDNCGTEAYAHWHAKEWGVGAYYCRGMYNGRYRYEAGVDRYDDLYEAQKINQQYDEHMKACLEEHRMFLESDAAKFCPVCGAKFFKKKRSDRGWTKRSLESAKSAGIDWYDTMQTVRKLEKTWCGSPTYGIITVSERQWGREYGIHSRSRPQSGNSTP